MCRAWQKIKSNYFKNAETSSQIKKFNNTRTMYKSKYRIRSKKNFYKYILFKQEVHRRCTMRLNCISPGEIAQIRNKQNVKGLLQMSTICVSFEIMVNEAMLNLSAWPVLLAIPGARRAFVGFALHAGSGAVTAP